MTAPDLASILDEGRRLEEEATDRDAPGFTSPLPYFVSGSVPMVYASDGDAIVSQMPDGTPYFESNVAAFVAFAANNLPFLLSLAAAGAEMAGAFVGYRDGG